MEELLDARVSSLESSIESRDYRGVGDRVAHVGAIAKDAMGKADATVAAAGSIYDVDAESDEDDL